MSNCPCWDVIKKMYHLQTKQIFEIQKPLRLYYANAAHANPEQMSGHVLDWGKTERIEVRNG